MEPTYDEITDLAARLGRWDCLKEWISYPTWVTPPRHGEPYLKIAARYRAWARDILLGKVAMPENAGTPCRDGVNPLPGPEGTARSGRATPRAPSTVSRQANALGCRGRQS